MPQSSYLSSDRGREDGDGDDIVMFSKSEKNSRNTQPPFGSCGGGDPSGVYRSRDSSSHHSSQESSSSTHQYRPLSHSLQQLLPPSSSSRPYYEDSSHHELPTACSVNASQEGTSSSSSLLRRGEIAGVGSHSHAWSLPPHRSAGLAPPSASAGSSYYQHPSFSSLSSSLYSPGSPLSFTLPQQQVEDESRSARRFLPPPPPPPPLVDLCSPVASSSSSSSSLQQDRPHPPGPAILRRGGTASSSSLSVDRRGIGRAPSDSHEYFISRDHGGRAGGGGGGREGEESMNERRLPGHQVVTRRGEERRGRREGEGRGEEDDEGRVSVCSSVSRMSSNEGSRAREVFSSSESFPSCLGRDDPWGAPRGEGRREARRQVVQIDGDSERKPREEDEEEALAHPSSRVTRRVVTYDGISSSPPPYPRPVSGDVLWKKTVSSQEAVGTNKDDFHRLHTTGAVVPKGGREISYVLSLGGPRHPIRSSSSSPSGGEKERMTSSSRKGLATSPSSIDEGNKTERHEKKEETRLTSSSHQKFQPTEVVGAQSTTPKDSTSKGSSAVSPVSSGPGSLASQTSLDLSKGSGGRPSPLALSPNVSSSRDSSVSTLSCGGAERHEGKKGDQQAGRSRSAASLRAPASDVSPASEPPLSHATSLRSSLAAPCLSKDGKKASSPEKAASPPEIREGTKEGRGGNLVCSRPSAFTSQTTRLSRNNTSLSETSSRPTAPRAASSSSSSSRLSAPAPSSSVCSPPAALPTRPPSTPASCPPATPVSRPPPTAAPRPPATAASRPPPTPVSRPPPTAASRPPAAPTSRPPAAPTSRPPAAPTSRPPAAPTSRPPSTAVSRPRPLPASSSCRPAPPASFSSTPGPAAPFASSRVVPIPRRSSFSSDAPPPGASASRPPSAPPSSSSSSRVSSPPPFSSRPSAPPSSSSSSHAPVFPPPSSSSSLQGLRSSSSSSPSSCPSAPSAPSASSSIPPALLPAPSPLPSSSSSSSSSPPPAPLSPPSLSSRPPSPITPPSSPPSEHQDARREAEGRSNAVPEKTERQEAREEGGEELLVVLTSSPGVTIEGETAKVQKSESTPVVAGGCVERKEEEDDNMDLGEDDDEEVICIGEKQQKKRMWFSPSSSSSSSSSNDTTACRISGVFSRSHHGRKAGDGGATIVLDKDNKQPTDNVWQGFSRWDRRERRREGGEVEGEEMSRRTTIATAKAVTSDLRVTNVSCQVGFLHRGGGEGGGGGVISWAAAGDHKLQEDKTKKREEGEEIRLAVKAALDRVEEFYTMGGSGRGGGESKERGVPGRSRRSDGKREGGKGEKDLAGRTSRRVDGEKEEERQQRNNLDSEGRDCREASVMVVRLAGGREQRDRQREAEMEERRERYDRRFLREETGLLRREEEGEGGRMTILRQRNQEEGEDGRRRITRESLECDVLSSQGLNEMKRRDREGGLHEEEGSSSSTKTAGHRESEESASSNRTEKEAPYTSSLLCEPLCSFVEARDEKQRERDSERDERQGDSSHSQYHSSSDMSAASPPGVFSSDSRHHPPALSSRYSFDPTSSSSSSSRLLHDCSSVETFPPPPSCSSSSSLPLSQGDSHRLSSQPFVSRNSSPQRSTSSSCSRSARKLYLEYRSRPSALPPSFFSAGIPSDGYGRRRTSRSYSPVSPRCRRAPLSPGPRLPSDARRTARPSSPTGPYSIHGRWSPERGERHQGSRGRRRERSRSERRTRSFSPFSRRQHADSSPSRSPSRCRRLSPRDSCPQFSPKLPPDSSTWCDHHRHNSTYRHHPPYYCRTEPCSSSSSSSSSCSRSPSRSSLRPRFLPPSISSSRGDDIGGRRLLSCSRPSPRLLLSSSHSHGGHQEIKKSFEDEMNKQNPCNHAFSADSQTGEERNIPPTSPPSDRRGLALPPLFSSSSSSSSSSREGRGRRKSFSSPTDGKTQDRISGSPRQDSCPPPPPPLEKTSLIVGNSTNILRSSQPLGGRKPDSPPLSSSSSSLIAASSHHTPSAIGRNCSRSDDDMSWSRNTASSSPSMSIPRGGVHTPEVLLSRKNSSGPRADVSSTDFHEGSRERREVFVWSEVDKEQERSSALHHPGASHRQESPRRGERNGEKEKNSSPSPLDNASQRKLKPDSRDNDLPSLRSKSRDKQDEKDGGGHGVWRACEGGYWAKEIPEESEGRSCTGKSRTTENQSQHHDSPPFPPKTGSLKVSSSSSSSLFGSSSSGSCRVEGGKTSLSLFPIKGPGEKTTAEICASNRSQKRCSEIDEGGKGLQEGIQKRKEREEEEEGKGMRVDRGGEGDLRVAHGREEGRGQEKAKGVEEEGRHSHSPHAPARARGEVAKASDKKVSQSEASKDEATRSEGGIGKAVDKDEGSRKLDSRPEKEDREIVGENAKEESRKNEEQEKKSPTGISPSSTTVPSVEGSSSSSSCGASSSSSFFASSTSFSSFPSSSSSCASSSLLSSSSPPASSPSSGSSPSSSSSSSSMSSLPSVSFSPGLSSPSTVLGSLVSTVCGPVQQPLPSRQHGGEKSESEQRTQGNQHLLLGSPDLPSPTDKEGEDSRKDDKQAREATDSGKPTEGLPECHALGNAFVGRSDRPTTAGAAAVQAQREEGMNAAAASSSPGTDLPREGKNEEEERQGGEGEERERGRREEEVRLERTDEPEKREMTMENPGTDGGASLVSAEIRREEGGDNTKEKGKEEGRSEEEEESTEKVKAVSQLRKREDKGEVGRRETGEEMSCRDSPGDEPSAGECSGSAKERRKAGEIAESAEGTSLQHSEGKQPPRRGLRRSSLASLPLSHQPVSTPLCSSPAPSPTLSSSASSSTSLPSTKASSSSSLSSPSPPPPPAPPVLSSSAVSSSVASLSASEWTSREPTANPPCAASSRSSSSPDVTISSFGLFEGNKEEGRKEEEEEKGTNRRDEQPPGSQASEPKEVDGGARGSSVISTKSSGDGSRAKSNASSPCLSSYCEGSVETRKQSHNNIPNRWDVSERIALAFSTSSSFSPTSSSSPSPPQTSSSSSYPLSSSFLSTAATSTTTTSSSAPPSPSPPGPVIITKENRSGSERTPKDACLSAPPSSSPPPPSSSCQLTGRDAKDVVSSKLPSLRSPPSSKETEGSWKAPSASMTGRETSTVTTRETREDEREMEREGEIATIGRTDEEAGRKSLLHGEKEKNTNVEIERRFSQIDLTGGKTSPLPRVLSPEASSSRVISSSSTSGEAVAEREERQISAGVLPKRSRDGEESATISCLLSGQERKAREEHEILRAAVSPPPPLPSSSSSPSDSPSGSAISKEKSPGVSKGASETAGEKNSKRESPKETDNPIVTATPSGAGLSKAPGEDAPPKKAEASHLVSSPSSTVVKPSTSPRPPCSTSIALSSSSSSSTLSSSLPASAGSLETKQSCNFLHSQTSSSSSLLRPQNGGTAAAAKGGGGGGGKLEGMFERLEAFKRRCLRYALTQKPKTLYREESEVTDPQREVSMVTRRTDLDRGAEQKEKEKDEERNRRRNQASSSSSSHDRHGSTQGEGVKRGVADDSSRNNTSREGREEAPLSSSSLSFSSRPSTTKTRCPVILTPSSSFSSSSFSFSSSSSSLGATTSTPPIPPPGASSSSSSLVLRGSSSRSVTVLKTNERNEQGTRASSVDISSFLQTSSSKDNRGSTSSSISLSPPPPPRSLAFHSSPLEKGGASSSMHSKQMTLSSQPSPSSSSSSFSSSSSSSSWTSPPYYTGEQLSRGNRSHSSNVHEGRGAFKSIAPVPLLLPPPPPPPLPPPSRMASHSSTPTAVCLLSSSPSQEARPTRRREEGREGHEEATRLSADQQKRSPPTGGISTKGGEGRERCPQGNQGFSGTSAGGRGGGVGSASSSSSSSPPPTAVINSKGVVITSHLVSCRRKVIATADHHLHLQHGHNSTTTTTMTSSLLSSVSSSLCQKKSASAASVASSVSHVLGSSFKAAGGGREGRKGHQGEEVKGVGNMRGRGGGVEDEPEEESGGGLQKKSVSRESSNGGGRSMMKSSVHAHQSMEIKTGAAAGKGEGGGSLTVAQRGRCRDTIGGQIHMKDSHSSGCGHISSHNTLRRRRIEVDDSLLIDLGQDEEEDDDKDDVSSSSSSSSFLFSSGSSTTSSARLHNPSSSSSFPSSASSSSALVSPSRLSSSSPPPSSSIGSSSALSLSTSPPSRIPGILEQGKDTQRKGEEKGIFFPLEAQRNDDLSSSLPAFSPPLKGATPPSHSAPPVARVTELTAGETLAQSSCSSSRQREEEMMKKKTTREKEAEEERRLTTVARRGGVEEKRSTAQVASFQKRGSESVLASKSTPPSLLSKSGPPRLRRPGDRESLSSTPPFTATLKDNRGRECLLHDGIRSPPSSSPPSLSIVSSSRQTGRRRSSTTHMTTMMGTSRDRFHVTKELPSLPASPEEGEKGQHQDHQALSSSSPALLSTGKALASAIEAEGGVLSLHEETRKEEQIEHNHQTGPEIASSTKTLGKESSSSSSFDSPPAHVEEKTEAISLPPLKGKKIHGRLSGGSLSEDGDKDSAMAASSTRRRRRSTRRASEVKGGEGKTDVRSLSSSSSVSLTGSSLHHVNNNSGRISLSTGEMQRTTSSSPRHPLPSEKSQLACTLPTAVRTRDEEEERQQEEETGEEKSKSRESQAVLPTSPGGEDSANNNKGDRKIIPPASSTTPTGLSSKDDPPVLSSIVTPQSCSPSSSSSSSPCSKTLAKGSPIHQDRTVEAILSSSSSLSSLPTDLPQKKKRKSLSSSSSSVSSSSVSASPGKIESFPAGEPHLLKKSCVKKKSGASSTPLAPCGVSMERGGGVNMTEDRGEAPLPSHLLHQRGGKNITPHHSRITHATLTTSATSSSSSSSSSILYSGCVSEGGRIQNTEGEEHLSSSFLSSASSSGISVSLSSPSSSGNSSLVEQRSSVSSSLSSFSSSPGAGKIPRPLSTMPPSSSRGSHGEDARTDENRKKKSEGRQLVLSRSCSSSSSSHGYLKEEDRRRDEDGEKNPGEKGHSVSPIQSPHAQKRLVLSPRPSTTLPSSSSVSISLNTAAPSSRSGTFFPASSSSSSPQPSSSSCSSSSSSSSNTHSRSSVASSLSPLSSSSLCSSSPSPKHISTSIMPSKTFSSSSSFPLQTSSTSRSHLSSPSHPHPPSSSLQQTPSGFPSSTSSDRASPSLRSSTSISSSHLWSSLVFLQREEAEARVREAAVRARHVASVHRLKCLVLEVKEAQKDVERLGQERILASRQVSLTKMKVERLEKLLLHQGGKTGKSSVSKGGGEERARGREGVVIDPSMKMKSKLVSAESQKNQLQSAFALPGLLTKNSQPPKHLGPSTASSAASKNKSSPSIICENYGMDDGVEKTRRRPEQGNEILPPGDRRERGREIGEQEEEKEEGGGESEEEGSEVAGISGERTNRLNRGDDLHPYQYEKGLSSHTTETFLSRLRERKKAREVQKEEEKKKKTGGDALLANPGLACFEISGRCAGSGKRKLETHENEEEEEDEEEILEGKTWKANNTSTGICRFSSSSSFSSSCSSSSSFSVLFDTVGEECEKYDTVACGLENSFANSATKSREPPSSSASPGEGDDSLGVSSPSYESLRSSKPSSSANPSLLLGVDPHSDNKTLMERYRKTHAGREVEGEEEEEKEDQEEAEKEEEEVLEFLPLPPIGSSRSFHRHRQAHHRGRKDLPSSSSSSSSSSSLSPPLTRSLQPSSSSSLSSGRTTRSKKSFHRADPPTSSSPLHSCEELPERVAVLGKKHVTKKIKRSEREREHGELERFSLISLPGHPKNSSSAEEEEDEEEEEDHEQTGADERFFSSSPDIADAIRCTGAISNSPEISDKERRRGVELTTRRKDGEWGGEEQEKKESEMYSHHGRARSLNEPPFVKRVEKDGEEEEEKKKKKRSIHHSHRRHRDDVQGGKKSNKEAAFPPFPPPSSIRAGTYFPRERQRYFHLHLSSEENQEKAKATEKKKKEDARQDNESREKDSKKNKKKNKGEIKEKDEQNSETNEKNEQDNCFVPEKRNPRVRGSEESPGEPERRFLPCTSLREREVKSESKAGNPDEDSDAVSSIYKENTKDQGISTRVTSSDEESDERTKKSKKREDEMEEEEENNNKQNDNKVVTYDSSFSSCSSSPSSRFFDVEEDYIPLIGIEDRRELEEKVREGLLHSTQRQAMEKEEEEEEEDGKKKKEDEAEEGEHQRTPQWREEDSDLQGEKEIAARVDKRQAKKSDSHHDAVGDQEKKKKKEDKKKDEDISCIEKDGEESRMSSPLIIHEEEGRRDKITKIYERPEEDHLSEDKTQSSSFSFPRDSPVLVGEHLANAPRKGNKDEVGNKEKKEKGPEGGEEQGEADEKGEREEKLISGDLRALHSLHSGDVEKLRGGVVASLPSGREEESAAAGPHCVARNEEYGEKEVRLTVCHQRGKESSRTPSGNFLSSGSLPSAVERNAKEDEKEGDVHMVLRAEEEEEEGEKVKKKNKRKKTAARGRYFLGLDSFESSSFSSSSSSSSLSSSSSSQLDLPPGKRRRLLHAASHPDTSLDEAKIEEEEERGRSREEREEEEEEGEKEREKESGSVLPEKSQKTDVLREESTPTITTVIPPRREEFRGRSSRREEEEQEDDEEEAKDKDAGENTRDVQGDEHRRAEEEEERGEVCMHEGRKDSERDEHLRGETCVEHRNNSSSSSSTISSVMLSSTFKFISALKQMRFSSSSSKVQGEQNEEGSERIQKKEEEEKENKRGDSSSGCSLQEELASVFQAGDTRDVVKKKEEEEISLGLPPSRQHCPSRHEEALAHGDNQNTTREEENSKKEVQEEKQEEDSEKRGETKETAIPPLQQGSDDCSPGRSFHQEGEREQEKGKTEVEVSSFVSEEKNKEAEEENEEELRDDVVKKGVEKIATLSPHQGKSLQEEKNHEGEKRKT